MKPACKGNVSQYTKAEAFKQTLAGKFTTEARRKQRREFKIRGEKK